MAIWFVGTSLLAMRWFFADQAIDHRLIVLGALLPDVAWAASAGAPLAHSLALPAVGLVAVMLVTIGRRRTRRRWLALPIGVFWHQVFDGAWMQPELFWWPLGGSAAEAVLPLAGRGVWVIVLMEVLGLIGCWWVWRSTALGHDRAARTTFYKTGRLVHQRSDPPAG